MSFAALAWATKQHVGSAAEKLILLAYADRHNEETGYAYPSIAWLCEFSSLNRKTVISAVSRLETAGLLTDTGERRGDTKQIKTYSVNIGTVPKTEPYQKRNSTKKVPKQSQKRDTDTIRTISKETNVSSDIIASAPAAPPKTPKITGWHRLPDDWLPRPLPAPTQAKVDQWPPGELSDELEALRNWAANAKDENGKGRKRDWDLAWIGWINRHDRDRRPTRVQRGQPASDMDAAMRDLGFSR